MPDTPPPAGPPEDLHRIRAEIDALDDAIHDLLMRRAGVVARMASIRAKGEGPVLRPGREAAVLRRLLARHAGPLPPAALVRIWRELMGGHTELQGGIAVAAWLPAPGQAEVLRAHLGGAAPILAEPSATAALGALQAGRAALAALPDPFEGGEAWWVDLAPGLHVTALLPVLGPAAARLVLVAPGLPDPSGADRSLLLGPVPPEGALRVLRAGGQALAEVEGFLRPDDPTIPPGARLLGAYAVPDPGAFAR
ncbi:MAG TPA: chorismate mutase [Acetobacteraceae bacterium]|jgi:chorismate mutase-like protein|nr:chorismate mutase [Acetobacteraceae bacterium]